MNYSHIFVSQAPNAIAMFDMDMCYLAASGKWISDYGLEGVDIIGKSHYEVFPEIGEDWKATHRNCLNGAISQSAEECFQRADGTEQWLTWDVRPWYANETEIGGIIMYTQDITARKLAEIQLEVSESQFRGVFESSAIGIAIVSLQGAWVKVNAALCNFLGYTEEELMGLTFQEITHPDDLEADLALVSDLIRGRQQYYQMEKRYLHKSGHYLWAILSVSLVRDVKGRAQHFVSQITDINTQRDIQHQLEEALSKLEGILDSGTQVSIISADTDGVITSFNIGAENLLGYHRDEMLHSRKLEEIHLAEELEQRRIELSDIYGINVSGGDVLTAMLRTQKYETREWRYVRKDGSRFPVQLTVTAIRDKGKIVGYLAIAADISEIKRVEAEMKSLLEVTRGQNARLKNFAHIVSHNLRSHAGNISVLIDLFFQEYPDVAASELVQHLRLSSEKLKETITHLNDVVVMNSTVEQSLRNLHLHTFVERAVHSIGALAGEHNVTFINEVDSSLHVAGVEAYLDSIIINFLTNGIKYRAENRAPFVRISSEVRKGYVVLNFQDNGIGMDMKLVRHKLFGMYKTFHGNKDARGIGLFITKNQVEALGGRIEVESTLDIGTVFKVYLKHEKN